MKRLVPALPVVALVVALVGACAPGPQRPEPRPLTVFAAASLRGVVEDLGAAWKARSGTAVTVATDSSAALRVQVEQGAPADVFLSADVDNAQRLVASGVAEGLVAFAGDDLAVAVSLPNEQALRTPADLANHGVRIIAARPDIPITGYAHELLARLADRPGYPEHFLAGYEMNVRSREDNARAIVTKLELGEGDAGIVYATDARAAPGVTTLPVPPGAGVVATYAGAVVRHGDREAGEAFLRWLTAGEAQAILAEAGFIPRR